jgi:predicted PhzF superfamily epimerase YddE/YHI9
MRIFQVDAFTDTPFRGNPAGVCLLEDDADDSFLQSVAAEMHCSETAFVAPGDGDEIGLRWFTPVVEVDLCGHATLAAAAVLWRSGLRSGPLRFATRSGVLGAEPRGGGAELDFPALKTAPTSVPDGLAEVLGVEPVCVSEGSDRWLVELADAEAVRALTPDFAALARLTTRLVITAAADDSGEVDFVSRVFAPAIGIDEDPVTGAAHCALGPFWAARLGRDDLVGYQASARGGRVGVAVRGDRVRLRGDAVIVFAGELLPEHVSSASPSGS